MFFMQTSTDRLSTFTLKFLLIYFIPTSYHKIRKGFHPFPVRSRYTFVSPTIIVLRMSDNQLTVAQHSVLVSILKHYAVFTPSYNRFGVTWGKSSKRF